MDYDFAVAANGTRQVDAGGNFFKYVQGDGLIQVRTSSGESVALLPGQGKRNVRPFTSFSVTDKSGSANTGVINAGEGDFIDDRISGLVTAADNDIATSKATEGFNWEGNLIAVAAQNSMWQLFNFGTRDIYLDNFEVESTTAGNISAYRTTAFAGWTFENYGWPKNTAGAVSSSSASAAIHKLNSASTLAALGLTVKMDSFRIVAATRKVKAPKVPIYIAQNSGMAIYHETVNSNLEVRFDFRMKVAGDLT